MKHGIEFIGKLWREARRPEDPIEAYQRITGVNQETFNDEMFDAARRFVNWDIDGIKEYGRNYVGRKQCKLIASKDGYYAIDPAECPENYGYNVIVLNVPSAGVKVSADFVGMAGADGYRKKNVDKAGWRYGFVAYLENGSCVYSDIFSEKEGEAIFECPNFCRKLYFVVSGAPTQHWRHAWDDNDMNDEQWPYKVRFSGTNLYGQIDVDPDKTPEDITLIYDVPVSLSSTDYTSSNVQIELQKLCQSFSLTPGQISDKWGKEIIFVGNWENAKDILSLLYDENSGIGLNIYRYNLGAGSKDDATITDLDRRAEAFIDKDGSYHWERDAAAQNALALARSMNEDLRVTLFSNSAPVFYTANGKAYCDYLPDEENYVTNLEPERYADFAKYSIACASNT